MYAALTKYVHMALNVEGMGGERSAHGSEEKCTQSCDRKPEGKRTLGRPKSRLEDPI